MALYGEETPANLNLNSLLGHFGFVLQLMAGFIYHIFYVIYSHASSALLPKPVKPPKTIPKLPACP